MKFKKEVLIVSGKEREGERERERQRERERGGVDCPEMEIMYDT